MDETITVDAPHGVQKEDEKPPHGNELKAPFGKLVVTGRRQMAARQTAAESLRGRTATSMLLLSALKRARWYTKPRKRWQRFKRVISSIVLKRVPAKPLPKTAPQTRARAPISTSCGPLFQEIVQDFNERLLRGSTLITPGAPG